MKVLVIGTGAVGSFYGALLAKQGIEVSVLARSDYDHIRQSGIDVESILGPMHFMPAQVVRHAAELAERPDYVLLCVKVVEQVDRVALLRESVGAGTAIVLIQNGIAIEEEIAGAFPEHELISGLAFICVTRTAPGKIWHQAYGRLVLGNYPRGSSDKAEAIRSAFDSSGISCLTTDDITSARWQKCVWNAAFNPLSVLSDGLGTSAILNSQELLVRAVMEEVAAIARSEGCSLPDDIVDRNVESTRKMPPYKTSMLLDFEAGRPLETEAILGNAVRAAHRNGLRAPHLETLYALLNLLEISRTNPRSED